MISNITWGADFAGIVRYLVENRDHEVLDLKGVTSVELAADEMAAVAALSSRAKNKLLHVSLSAALEDGSLDASQWLHCADELTVALRLVGLQRVVVRHKDKAHDHVHIFFCTIDSATGQTPPKSWYLKKGNAMLGIGPHALSESEIVAVPLHARALRTYDFRALARTMDICRKLERQLGLRTLRTPVEAAQARLAGVANDKSAAQRKRHDRIGSTPLIERADEIRGVLGTRDWPSKRDALCALGLDFEPTYRTTKKGTELRGLTIFDMRDTGNRIRASDLDLPSQKFGLLRLEARHDPGADRFDIWWPRRGASASAIETGRDNDHVRLKSSFDLFALQHRTSEREKANARKKLRKEQTLGRARLRKSLMRRRRDEAARLPSSERRAFYRRYAADVSRPELASLSEFHSKQKRNLARSRKPTWTEYLQLCAEAGDISAARLVPPPRAKPRNRIAEVVRNETVIARAPGVISQPAPNIVQNEPDDLSPDDLFFMYQASKQRGRD
ncbi:relaxase/mobilization nuclease domain-containing protein [Sphingopyxis sp. H115]|uniref:relaxase/mobilization nuclease domain-containing protein n=1 Tax=Sphingopyxis sp. H115 TaxID=1759073 RepID=UPI000736174E|nr:relaxase/mobilization nuclease domain-containing protein [Sphingopyxis sp. H115]KTE05275.1 hypothetical protein ATE71_18525 [Sphingopyxis sp. H115]